MNRKFARGGLLGIAVVLVSTLVTASVAFGQATTVRWDIVSLNFTVSPPTLSAGGVAAARADDGATITLTGSGTFVVFGASDGLSSAVTGGGTWATSGSVGDTRGTYSVTELVRWERSSGVVTFRDLIGDPAKASGGLAVLRIKYSDGSLGILVVSCNLGGVTPSIFEGITVSKSFVDFFDRVPPVPGVNANRTLFHLQ